MGEVDEGASMVARVAKAIYQGRNGAGCKPWGRLPTAHRDPYLADARAALGAMREPTDEMLEEGEGAHASATGYQYSGVAEAYEAMIDVALSERSS